MFPVGLMKRSEGVEIVFKSFRRHSYFAKNTHGFNAHDILCSIIPLGKNQYTKSWVRDKFFAVEKR